MREDWEDEVMRKVKKEEEEMKVEDEKREMEMRLRLMEWNEHWKHYDYQMIIYCDV